MSHEWTCRCPACVRELDLPRDEPEPDDDLRARYESGWEGGEDAGRDT
jgi:hypothetical protein